MFSHVVSVLVLQWTLLCKIVVQVRLTVDDMCKRRFTSEYYRRALATLEPLMGEAWCVRCMCMSFSAVATSMLCSTLSVLCHLFALF